MAFNVTDLGSLLPKNEGLSSFAPKVADEGGDSFLWKTLDKLNRPYSAVMGGVTGAISDNEGVLGGMRKGFMGEKSFSALDVAGGLGYDTASQGVRNAALLADVVNPLDPLNYLTFGLNKAGRVGKGIALASKTGENAEMLTRAGAAAAGKWSPVSFANVSLVPRSVAMMAAKPADAIAQKVDRFAKTNAVLKHFGGMRKFEEQNPDFLDVLRGLKSAADLDERTYTEGMTKVVEGLRKQGYDDNGIAAVMPQVFDLVESPASRMARIDTEIAKIDDGTWTGPLLPWKGEKDIADETAAFMEDQEKLRVVITSSQPSGISGELPIPGAPDPHIAKAVTIDPTDPAPQDFMLRRREKLLADKKLSETFREGVAPDILSVVDELAEWRQVMQEKYSVLKQYDETFEFPYEDYMPHVLPHNASRREKRIVEQANQKELARRTELAAKGFSDAVIEQKLAKEFRNERAAAGTVMTGAQMRGEIPAANKRKYDMTAKEARIARNEGFDIPEWNEFAPVVLDNANMHATRWRLAHDAHKKMMEMGQTVKGDDFRALDAAKKREYVPIDFKVPWIAQDKNPFRDQYMKREAYDLMRKELGAANFFTGRGGQSALMELLHKARHQWVSWTLGPFPSTHTRNFVSDVTQNFLGGLNPLADLAKAPAGDSAYMTAMAITARNSFVPLTDANKDFAKAGISKLTQQVGQKFGTEFTEDMLLDEMRKRRILGDTHLRDDLELAIQESKLTKNVRDNRSMVSKLGDWVSPNADRNKAVQLGFKAGGKAQDFTRSALFVHALKEGMNDTDNLDTALTYAETQVRKHLFDYGDLTGFERDVMRLVIPFYCVPVSHEILTRRGWATYDTLTVGEDVMSYENETGKFHWVPLQEVATFDYDGDLIEISTKSGTWQCTEDHRWPIITTKSFVKGRHYGGKRIMKRTYEINTSDTIPIIGDFLGKESILSPRHAAILGWVVTDGYFRWRGNHCEMMVYQSPKKFLAELLLLLETKGRKPHPDTGVICVPVAHADAKAICKVFKDRNDLSSIVCNLSREAAEAMWDAMFKAEGCITPATGQMSFAQECPKVLNAFQILTLMVGRTGRLNSRGLNVRTSRSLFFSHAEPKRIAYKGEIWCPKTEHGTWVMRNNGAPIITGNTFTSKNIPLQLGKAVTEPGRHAWINRGFQGAWAGPTDDADLNYEDLPEWMQNAVGVPIRKMKDKDGNDAWSVSTLRGWLPQTELNELADAIRGEKFLGFFAERMNPIFKEFFEQAMNYDSYVGRAIDEGQTVEMGGIDIPPRAAHLVRNVRLFNELDKMNPLGLWTKIWETYGAKEGSGRPHRREAVGQDRAVRQLTGLNFYTIDAEKEATRRMTDSMRDITKKTSAARWAARVGQTRESEKYLQEVQELQAEARAAQQRLNQVRKDKATKMAAKYRSDL